MVQVRGVVMVAYSGGVFVFWAVGKVDWSGLEDIGVFTCTLDFLLFHHVVVFFSAVIICLNFLHL